MIDILSHSKYFLPSIQKIYEIDSINIIKKIIDNCLFEEKFVFGIRVNEQNEWLDRELAQKIIEIFKKTGIKSNDKMNEILSYFYNHDEIKDNDSFLNKFNHYLDQIQGNNIKVKPNEHFNLIRQNLYIKVINRIKGIITKSKFCEKHKIDKIVFNETDENSWIIVNSDSVEINNNAYSDDILTTINSFEFKRTEQKSNVKPKIIKRENFLNLLDMNDIQNIKKVKKIGEGSQSKVYKATYYQKEVALKVMKYLQGKEYFPKFQKLMQECEFANLLNHPNIIKTFGFYYSDDEHPPFILFELHPYNLHEIVKDLTDVERVTIIYEICLAMNEVHKSNMIHRDLKPENILLDENKHVKLNDFGISCLINVETQIETMTYGVGTFNFMSPEMLNQDKHYTNKVDVYSFGVVVFFILTNGNLPSCTISDIVNGKKVSIPNYINKVSAYLIDWCLSFKAIERPSFSQIIAYINNQQFNLIDGVNISEIKRFLSL